jgi:hypothetical protein
LNRGLLGQSKSDRGRPWGRRPRASPRIPAPARAQRKDYHRRSHLRHRSATVAPRRETECWRWPAHRCNNLRLPRGAGAANASRAYPRY